MRWWPASLVVMANLTMLGCERCSPSEPAADAGAVDAGAAASASAPSDLDTLLAVPEARRAEILAQIGDREITLGEIIDAIARLPPDERAEAATREGRREVLDRLVRDALLAAEARRLGLHDRPALRDALTGMLAEALLAEERAKLPKLDAISDADARRFYDEHPERYLRPELRRAEVLVFSDRAAAERAVSQPPSEGWTNLGEITAAGLVTGAGHRKADPTARVAESIRSALFSLAEVGQVHAKVADADGKHYVVRLGGVTRGHERTFEEVNQIVRTDFLQQRWTEREEALEKEARERFPVSIDEDALERTEPPRWLDEIAKSRSRPGSR